MRCVRTWGVAILLSGALCASASAQTIFEAARAGDVGAVRALLDADPARARARDEAENTPLHAAGAGGHAEVVALLLARGAEVDAANYEQETPLHWAVLQDRLEVAGMLLDCGAATEARESYGRTPLLLVARETGDLAMARRLIEAGADVDARDRFGATPLELSTWRGFGDVVDLLLDRGAGVPSDDDTVRGWLGMATERGLVRLFRILAERTASLDLPNGNGGTLLHSAAAGGSVEIAEALLDRGLDPDAADRYGRTSLHYAAENGRTEVVGLLLERGADPGVRSLAGTSPLDAAEAFERTAAAELLVRHGAARAPAAFPVLRGPYLGQPAPGREARLFAPDIVSTHTFQHGSITFSPDGTEAFWVSSLPEVEAGYSYGRILTSRLENGRWTPPAQATFSRPRVGDDVPIFHPDGSRLFFLSSRDGDGEHIWWVERTAGGWSEPSRIEDGPNTLGTHWQFSVASDGSVYFNSADPGGHGRGDLYVSRLVDGRYQDPVNLGEPVNSEVDEAAPFVAPDQSYLLFMRVRAPDNIGMVDLYASFRTPEGRWSPPRNLGPSVNAPAQQICPVVSPDGRYLFFNSSRNGNADVYWMDASVVEEARQAVVTPDLSRVATGEGWTVFNREARTRAMGTSPGVYLDGGRGFGIAWLDGISFTDGTLEVTLEGKNVPQASFLGLAFHGVDDETFEAVYFRPFNFLAEDPAARSHAVQYVAHPTYTWQRLRADSPGAYEAALAPAPPPDAPFKARIEVAGDTVRVFVNGASSPSLEVRSLAGRTTGRVGLWVGNNSDGSFADLRIRTRSPAGAP